MPVDRFSQDADIYQQQLIDKLDKIDNWPFVRQYK